MKYPPFSWLRLSEEIEKSPSRIWFSFDKLPEKQRECLVTIQIGSEKNSFTDPYNLKKNLVLSRQQKVLDILLAEARPSKSKSEFFISHALFSKILPFCTAIPFEVTNLGILSIAKQPARIKAFLKNKDEDIFIEFSLVKSGIENIADGKFFGDINAYVIAEDAKVFPITPAITPEEAESILSSVPLSLLGLCQKESREVFYALSRLGIDFTCMNEIAKNPDNCQIYLRLLLSIDDITEKLCARVHLVTQIVKDDFKDEVEIKSTGSIPAIHVAVDNQIDEEKYYDDVKIPTFLRRPHQDENNARQYLYQLGAGPSRHHDGFELTQDKAFELIKAIGQKDMLPSYLKLDEHTRPNIIELPQKPILILKASEKGNTRIDVALSLGDDFDKEGADFKVFKKTRENILVLNEDTLVLLNEDILSSINYFSQTFGLEKPLAFKDKALAQVALITNSLKNYIDIKTDESTKDIINKFSLSINEQDKKLPKDLIPTLRPYQLEAVAWLSSLFRSGLGGLLGDEMGLGKTLMVLTHLAKLKEEGRVNKPALVVCPTSVIDVWVEEAKRHIPTLKVEKWHGLERHSKQEMVADCDILITSYAILRRDIDSALDQMEFSTLVLDEAQYIRNQQTDSFKSAKSINCVHKIALTGTPIENRISDLFNILDCVEDGILGTKSSFEKQFGGKIDEQVTKEALTLKMLLAPIVTRRKKSEVESELPPKIESVVHCKLTDEQKELYSKYVNQLSSVFSEDSANEKDKKYHFTLLSALTRLRQICCHPMLVTDDISNINASGKLQTLREILAECLEMGRKIIIYSQFLKMQELIVQIAKELDPKGALWLHGSTKNRDEIIKEFQSENGPNIIVVSLKAGGTGITLTRADTVIFADPWWNPAVEDQAIDRAHRIGQKKTVHVIRIIADNSIECEVLALAQRKRTAAQSILHDGFKSASSLTKEEIKALLLHEIDRLKTKK